MSYRVWRQRYNSDPAVIGSSFTIDGAPFTLAGVAPDGFFGDTVGPDPPDFWLPLSTEPAVHGKQALLDREDSLWLYSIGRVKPGARASAIESRVNPLLQQWEQANSPPANDKDRKDMARQHITVTPAGGGVALLRESFGDQLRLLGLITGMVPLIACANLANLQLARAASAEPQMALRAALGAQQSRLIRQALVESAMLAIGGGAAGLLVANWVARILIALAFRGADFVPIDPSPSLPVMAFAFALALVTGLIFGIGPAWSASRTDPAEALRGAGRAITGRETASQRALIVLQTALSLSLVAAAGMLIVTLGNLTNQNFGLDTRNRYTVSVNAALSGYAPEKIASVYRKVRRRVAAIPGVEAESMALYGPLEGNNWQTGISVEKQPGKQYSPSWDRVSPGFFDVIGAKVIQGRTFTDADTPTSTHVAVVNRAFAAKIFPNENPIGKRFGLGGPANRADYLIVGVIDDVRFRNPRGPSNDMFFIPLLQMSETEWARNGLARSNLIGSIQIHTSGNAGDLGGRLREAISGVDDNLTVLRISRFDEELGDLVGGERLLARLAEGFGALALLSAAVGLYGVTSYAAAHRRNEIGIRGALGANRANILALVMRSALGQVVVGALLGLPGAYAAGRLLASQLWSVEPFDPLIVGCAAAVLLLSAIIASVIPAVRATGIDPATALRGEYARLTQSQTAVPRNPPRTVASAPGALGCRRAARRNQRLVEGDLTIEVKAREMPQHDGQRLRRIGAIAPAIIEPSFFDSSTTSLSRFRPALSTADRSSRQ